MPVVADGTGVVAHEDKVAGDCRQEPHFIERLRGALGSTRLRSARRFVGPIDSCLLTMLVRPVHLVLKPLADVLARNRTTALLIHGASHPLPPVSRLRPYIYQIGIAHRVRQQPSHLDHSIAKACHRDVLGLLEGQSKSCRRATVVEVIGCQITLADLPVDAYQRRFSQVTARHS